MFQIHILPGPVVVVGSFLLAAACSGGGLSSTEAREAAEERVRQELGLSPEAALFSNVFVGRAREGGDEPVLCGTVAGTEANGRRIEPRRFIVAIDEPRWLAFEPLNAATAVTTTDKFAEWIELCTGARGDNVEF